MADRDIEEAEWRGEVTATLKAIKEDLKKLNEVEKRLTKLELRVYCVCAGGIGLAEVIGKALSS